MTKFQRLCYATAVQIEKQRPTEFDGNDTGVADIKYWHELLTNEWIVQKVIAECKAKP